VRLCISIEKQHGSVPVPRLESIGLMLALSVRPLDLQDGVRPVARRRGEHERNLGAGERVAERKTPPVDASLDQIRKLLEPRSSVVVGCERLQAGRDVRLRPP
jgi:hypothetical protein